MFYLILNQWIFIYAAADGKEYMKHTYILTMFTLSIAIY